MLFSRKMEINYLKRNSSMMEFAAINENGTVAGVNELVAALQSGLMKGNRLDKIGTCRTSQASQSNVSCSAGCYFRRSRRRYSFMKISCANKSILKPDPHFSASRPEN